MKMSKKSYQIILESFNINKEQINAYIPKLKDSNNYKDFNTRLAFDCARAFLELDWICSLYDSEKLNDTHLKTAYIKALKELNIL